MESADEIIWLNHAGYELRTAGLRIVHDPWLDGTAFDGGWALAAPSAHRPADLAGADYLWLSHEHPDHFQPSVFRAIPEQHRGTITVLYQQTCDQRVAVFCRDLGFKVQELPDRERVPLSPGVFVTCGTSGDDSWLYTETPTRTYLNTNDVVGCDWRAEVARFVRPVDVLFAQFSYATGTAAPDDVQRMRTLARTQMAFMEDQLAATQARYLIPFASFMWFCREENFHLNAYANTIDHVLEYFSDGRAVPIILYPGDRWLVGEPWANSRAVARYLADVQQRTRPLAPRPPVLLAELISRAEALRDRLARANSLPLLRPAAFTGLIRPVGIWLADLHLGVRYDMFMGLTATRLAKRDCDLELASGSLAFALSHSFGFGTLMVNGCYRELRPDALRRLSRHFLLGAQNARNQFFPRSLFEPAYLRANAPRLVTALARRLRPNR